MKTYSVPCLPCPALLGGLLVLFAGSWPGCDDTPAYCPPALTEAQTRPLWNWAAKTSCKRT